MMRARKPPAEGLKGLSDYFSRLEDDIDSFSAALSQLSDARKGITRQRPVAGSRSTRGQLKRTTGDATATLGVGFVRTEELSDSPTGSLGSLCVLVIAAGILTACCVWGIRQKVGHVALNST